MDLTTKLKALPGVGPSVAGKLEKLGLFTVEDLLHHYPFRYEDYSNITPIAEAQVDKPLTIKGDIWSIQNQQTRYGKTMTKAILNDGSSSVELLWFNQAWLAKSIIPGSKLQVSGKLEKNGPKLSMMSPEWEKIPSWTYDPSLQVKNHNPSDIRFELLHTGRLVPVYPETAGLSSKWFRTKLASLLPLTIPDIKEYLPEEIRQGFVPYNHALKQIHFPDSPDEMFNAKKRLAYDELILVQLNTQKLRSDWQLRNAVQPLQLFPDQIQAFIASLPFELTPGQQKVLDDLYADVQSERAMNRLVQGEVGSGKTIVATIMVYLTYLNGMNSLVMAPTEILAFQHFNTISKLLEPLGIKVGIYTGSKKFTKEAKPPVVIARNDSDVAISDFTLPDGGALHEVGKQRSPRSARDDNSKEKADLHPHVIIGTHAILSEKLLKENIGLVVVDEQQRFGVSQRSILRTNASGNDRIPHFLTMTATPIPRTVALTMYGDLDVSMIVGLPKGRQEIKTHVVPSIKRNDAYGFIRQKVKGGDQVYLITPLIEESETLATAKAATVEYELLKTKVFPDLRLGLLHGRLKPKDKEATLAAFREHQIDILVSTSVVEVGVDVPNATVMVIEGAERFGLAQIHQLRGRVGRGSKESFCLLFTETEEPQVVSRLRNLERISNGLELAEIDLSIRGSGQIFGTAQSGRFELKLADFSDLALIEKARHNAQLVLSKDPTLDKYPRIKAKLGDSLGVMPD